MTFCPNFQITSTIAQFLLDIERNKEAIHYLPITGKVMASLRETARLMTTHYSTQIEGNTLSPQEVKSIANGQKGGFPGRERDEKEVRNYFLALEFVEEQAKNKVPVSEKLIKIIHSLVYKGTKRQNPYREGQNVIRDGSTGAIVYMPPEAHDVPKMMKDLVLWITKKDSFQHRLLQDWHIINLRLFTLITTEMVGQLVF